VKIADIKALLWECKADIEEGVCGGCGDFSPDHPCSDSCEHMRKIKALEKATDLLEVVELLQTPSKESTNE
jgi:hypothetical protein